MAILYHEHIYKCLWLVTIETREENLSSLVKTDLHCWHTTQQSALLPVSWQCAQSVYRKAKVLPKVSVSEGLKSPLPVGQSSGVATWLTPETLNKEHVASMGSTSLYCIQLPRSFVGSYHIFRRTNFGSGSLGNFTHSLHPLWELQMSITTFVKSKSN